MTRVEFEGWIEAHYDDLMRVARLRVKNEDDALDVMQQAVARMLESSALDGRPVDMAWPWAAGVIRSVASTLRRSLERAETALGRAGALLYEDPPAPGGDRAWFLGPRCWRQVADIRAPRLKPPRPDEPFGEHTVQPGPPCSKCQAMTFVYFNSGRDYDKWFGRERVRYLARRCINGHEAPAEMAELTVRR